MFQALNLMLHEKNPHQIAAFLILLKSKGETVEELVGMAKALEAKMMEVPVRESVLDIVGTGGAFYFELSVWNVGHRCKKSPVD